MGDKVFSQTSRGQKLLLIVISVRIFNFVEISCRKGGGNFGFRFIGFFEDEMFVSRVETAGC